MLSRERSMPVMQTAPASPYDRSILRLAFLAPDIQHDIMQGLQPPGFNLEAMKSNTIPLTWSQQRQALGWGQTETPCSAE